MKKSIIALLSGITLLAAGFTSCSSDDDTPETGSQDFSKLPPGLYVTTVDTISFKPIKVDKHLYIDVHGGFFARGVNVFPPDTPSQDETWTLDSVYWTQIDSVIKVERPSAPIKFANSPWDVDTTFKVSDWLWIERAKPLSNPSLRPMIVKINKSGILFPRDIRLFLSQKPYSCEYPVTQFGLNNNYLDIQGRSVSVDALPAMDMKAVRQPDGSFIISRR